MSEIRKNSAALTQEQEPFVLDLKKQCERSANLGVSNVPFEKVAADVRGVRMADKPLQRDLHSLRIARVRYRVYLRDW